ncbi:succinylglutamate desuccinylase/aspartoacylase family protein [Spongiivirga citrea]|uniref:Aspartoacylase n=1 Tax=Spongiivirga citrea TaxID=1481457 RepID=A0A6M0CG53_9FLAO|nr:succinylglutamate desuccinylase/aspartoacylase family protein [Spongiivirga citrea]NER16821.1 aspartoacylase [Spongiivirga citrea]
MTEVYSQALNETIKVNRIIGHIKGSQPGTTLIFMAGMHGNEPAGVFAIKQVLDEIEANKIPICGNIYAISGNLWALDYGKRYHENDLNRLWTKERIQALLDGSLTVSSEDIAQQIAIYNEITKILKIENGPFYFMDLHTTSSETIPFAVVNDSLLNRKFTMQYPVPLILGIEEYLEGPLLSYINELGYVAFGYESGQHNDISSIHNHIAFIYLTLVFSESVSKDDIDFYHYYELLAKTSVDSKDVYEIYYRYKIKPSETFKMEPGFVNFQHVKKGEQLATRNGAPIFAHKNGRIFMPLYQSQGDEGYFSIQRIPRFILHLSAILRNIHFDKILPLLPGIKWASDKRDTLIVNRKIARFFAKQFFHLLGYRSKKIDKTHLRINSRETASRDDDYRHANWYNWKNS